MQPKSPASANTLPQTRASVTARRKMASLRVSLQRRRLRRISQLCFDNSAIFTKLSTESNPTGSALSLRDVSSAATEWELNDYRIPLFDESRRSER